MRHASKLLILATVLVAAPALAKVAMDAGPVNVAVNIDTTGLGIGTGAFGGFLRGGAGGGDRCAAVDREIGTGREVAIERVSVEVEVVGDGERRAKDDLVVGRPDAAVAGQRVEADAREEDRGRQGRGGSGGAHAGSWPRLRSRSRRARPANRPNEPDAAGVLLPAGAALCAIRCHRAAGVATPGPVW